MLPRITDLCHFTTLFFTLNHSTFILSSVIIDKGEEKWSDVPHRCWWRFKSAGKANVPGASLGSGKEKTRVVKMMVDSNIVPQPTYNAHLPSIINNKPRTQRQKQKDCQNTSDNWWEWRKSRRGEVASWKTGGAESRFFFPCHRFSVLFSLSDQRQFHISHFHAPKIPEIIVWCVCPW